MEDICGMIGTDRFEFCEQIGMWKFIHLFDIILLEKFEFDGDIL